MSIPTNNSCDIALLQHARARWLTLGPHDVKALIEIQDTFQGVYDRAKDATVKAMAGEKLALLYLQFNEPGKADAILAEFGFTCRLATSVFHYDTCNSRDVPSPSSPVITSTIPPPCLVLNNVFSTQQLTELQRIFYKPAAPYWIDHEYCVEPPSPYVSYVSRIADLPSDSLLQSVVQVCLTHLKAWKPAYAQQTNYVELWAHNRPHATAHQLHLDSDNEGTTETIRHPLVTCIVALSKGAPTLMTNQRLVSTRAAQTGWLAHPRPNRMILMDGRVLHCVVAGRMTENEDTTYNSNKSGLQYDDDTTAPITPPTSNDHSRRVTVMLAFWKRIRVRNETTAGAARPLTGHVAANKEWSQQLLSPFLKQTNTMPHDTIPPQAVVVEPMSVSHVYESVESGEPWTNAMGLPDYEQVFQGI
jgi:hypothetical protein